MTLDDFLGTWRLSRGIVHADGSRARFDGAAEWRACTGGALCEERGTLVLPGRGRFHAERRFRWDAALCVYFEDDRFFHRVPAEGGMADHDCPPDSYAADYDFARWPDWSCTWRVRGPHKDYTMRSEFRRPR